ncbi:hypothetical protein METBIDRAFT_38805 [Metschnikowia bicuspidata var. bicuspidata NRRL YB-4993]|uniref:Uncharacterized protein n=1 Tax=Metschnikowia bicuspidata var. bicuspidata NRRL YB-4993 TaxID=869754 RepID=A0A1A0HDC8_9ASCO|nr:hypothetical protein METBIDRAFT_38805 [Metschnikowia bicuspidata var. bicuspidata NRRL YB-4993]OBA22021.1 hypothetical protein METBIDRAFT_38805 [Metschnikowia bicuspidata var. bicuspidata NRRL YB-4993]
MDIVADSDTENSLPPVLVSDVNTATFRSVFAFFSDETRSRIRAEAQNTPLAALYEDMDADFLHAERLELENLLESTRTSENRPENGPMEPLAHGVEQPQETNSSGSGLPAPDQAFRRARSLRKRTFASRHPYIADQADWLGICTVDSINEMFDGDEDVSRVARALNQLYLQKKKRYPDEDRYRLKDFYAHLGHSKTLALEGDPDASERKDKTKQETANSDSQEQDYNPDIHSSQIETHSADDDDQLIPYEDFDIPYTQEHTDNRSLSAGPVIDSSSIEIAPSEPNGPSTNHTDESSTDYESDDQPDQYIKVGGRYRKVSTILRGVLPESAKRLGLFDRKSPVKRRRPAVRPLTPRRGLAIKKLRSTGTNSADLERELYSNMVDFEEEDHSRSFSVPHLSRDSTSMSYDLETQEPQYISSGSDSETEAFFIQHPFPQDLHSPKQGGRNYDYHRNQQIEEDNASAVEDNDEIDHLFASRSKPRRSSTHVNSRALGEASRRSHDFSRNTPRIPQARFKGFNISMGPPATTTRKRKKQRTAGSKRLEIINKLQTRLPAFRQLLQQQVLPVTPPKTPHSTQKKASSHKHELVPRPTGALVQQHFRRNPLVSTLAIETESDQAPRGERHVVFDSAALNFYPTRESLLGSIKSTSSSSLTGIEDPSTVRSLRDGRIFFPLEDSISIHFVGKTYLLALYNREDSFRHVLSLLTSLRKLLANTKMFSKLEVQAETRTALIGLIKWLLIYRGRPTSALWTQLKLNLEDFSKLQLKDVRKLQFTIHAQLIFIFWVLIQLEHSYNVSLGPSSMKCLEGFCSDFFVIFFSTFTAQDLSSAYAAESPNHDIFEAIMIIFNINEKESKYWWPCISQAIDEIAILGKEFKSLLDSVYLLGAIIPKKYFNWGPFLLVLNKMKTSVDSLSHRHFIDTCELTHQRLEWPFEEKILTQLYAFFGARKFSNFVDESNIPSFVGVVRSRADVPEESTFERFLGLLYGYISNLSLAKDLKRLMSKMLASSPYHYFRGRKSQIMFANRLNLIVLLAQVSDVDFGNQLTNLIIQICDSADAFVYGRSLDALRVISETANNKNTSIPLKAFVVLLKSLISMTAKKLIPHTLFQNLIDLMGDIFRGTSNDTDKGVFGLLKVLSTTDLSKIPETSVLDVLGTALLSIMEIEILETELNHQQSSILTDFQKSLLKLLSAQMDRISAVKSSEDEIIEETVELTIQIWMLSSKMSKTQHWNNMMYQKFSYLGNSISRNRFIMFLCLEFIHYATVDSFELQEIEKVFLNGLVSPNLSKYSVDLYQSLSRNEKSIFWSPESQILNANSVLSLENSRLRILTKAMQKVVDSSTLHVNEKSSFILGFVKRLHDIYTDHHVEQGVAEMCKRVAEMILRIARDFVADFDEFWEFSTKVGLPNKNLQNKWFLSDEAGKVQLLNQEFVSALVYEKNHFLALDNWITRKVDVLLFTLLQVYVSALIASNAYWAHVSLLLEYVYVRLENFDIDTANQGFLQLLNLLKEISLISNCKTESRYIIYEIRAMNACVSILKHAFYVFDGYKDQQDIKDMIFGFIANVNLVCPRQYKLTTVFMNLSFDALQGGLHISYHPKYQHTIGEYQAAWRTLKAALEDLTNLASGAVQEELYRTGLDDFAFF